MEFIRISEHMVKCEVTEADLNEFDVSIEDFFTRSESAMELLQEIVRQAEIAVDYKPDGQLTTLQIAPAGSNGLTIFLSEHQKFDLAGLLKGLRDYGGVPIDDEVFKKIDKSSSDEQMGFFAKLLDNIKKEVEKNVRSSESENETGSGIGSGKIRPKESESAKRGRIAANSGSDRSAIRIFVFDHIGQVMEYASSLGDLKGIRSGLYKDNDSSKYYLCIDGKKVTPQNFAKVVLSAHEYATLVSDKEEGISYVKEHCECLIGKDALSKIRG